MNVIRFSPTSLANGGTDGPAATLMDLRLEDIYADDQIRANFEEGALASLAESLKGTGQIVPIMVYYDKERGKHVIIDGERRFRAAKLAQYPSLDALVFSFKPTPAQIALVQLTIDQQREDLDAIDQAQAYAKVMDLHGWNATELAGHIHVSHTTITRAISLLALPNDLKADIRAGKLSPGVARELVRLPDVAAQLAAWERVKAEGLNSEQTQKLVRRMLSPKVKKGRPKSKDKFTYKNLSGFEAVVSPKKLTLVSTNSGTPRTQEHMLKALEILLQKLREDMAKEKLQNGDSALPLTGQDANTQH